MRQALHRGGSLTPEFYDQLVALESTWPVLEKKTLLAVVRAEVENRLGHYPAALAVVHDARRKSLDPSWSPELSLAAARAHMWRPEVESCSAELLRAIAEARAIGRDDLLAAALVMAGQLSWETGRYEQAVSILESALSSDLNAAIRERATMWLARSRNAAGDHAKAESELSQIIQDSTLSKRNRFLAFLELARAAASTERQEEANRYHMDAESLLPDDAHAFEHIELAESRAMYGSIAAEERRRLMYDVVDRYREDALFARLAQALIERAQILKETGAEKDATSDLAEAANIVSKNGYVGLRTQLLMAAQQVSREQIVEWLFSESGSRNQSMRYITREKLGAGGQAQVYRGLDLFTGKDCALKYRPSSLQSDALDADIAGELRAGITALAHVADGSVAAVRDFYIQGGSVVLVSPLVEGKPLSECNFKAWTQEKRLKVANDIAGALESIHRAGLVHGDIKPANVVVDEANWQTTIIDFGAARIVGRLQSSQRLLGTAAYAAPEMSRPGFSLESPKPDIFAFGVLLSELIAPKQQSWFTFGIGRSRLAELIQRMTHPDPERRPDASQIKKALVMYF